METPSSEHAQSDDPKPDPNKQRSNVILEIIDTEEQYVADMEVLQKYFVRELQSLAPTGELSLILSSVELILKTNQKLLIILKDQKEKVPIKSDILIGLIFLGNGRRIAGVFNLLQLL